MVVCRAVDRTSGLKFPAVPLDTVRLCSADGSYRITYGGDARVTRLVARGRSGCVGRECICDVNVARCCGAQSVAVDCQVCQFGTPVIIS